MTLRELRPPLYDPGPSDRLSLWGKSESRCCSDPAAPLHSPPSPTFPLPLAVCCLPSGVGTCSEGGRKERASERERESEGGKTSFLSDSADMVGGIGLSGPLGLPRTDWSLTRTVARLTWTHLPGPPLPLQHAHTHTSLSPDDSSSFSLFLHSSRQEGRNKRSR